MDSASGHSPFPINSRHQEVATRRKGQQGWRQGTAGFQSIAATKKWRLSAPVLEEIVALIKVSNQ